MIEDEVNPIQPATVLQQLGEKVSIENERVQLLKREIGKVIIGQEYMVDRLLIALLCNGHLLLEGVPGLAKTLAIKTLSDSLDVSYNRIQFTPDLLPADITGTQMYDQKAVDSLFEKVQFLPILF